jgi:thioredoxin-related protein
MRRFVIIILALFISSVINPIKAQQKTKEAEKITWLSYKDAVAQNKKAKKKKKIFIDVYTDWCGWCKKMESSTFKDSTVIAVMNKYFLPVRFNAECADTVIYKGNKYVNPSPGSSRSAHQFAVTLLQGQLNYPAFVFLKADENSITKIYGYREASEFIKMLKYYGEDIYLTQTWADYIKNTAIPQK